MPASEMANATEVVPPLVTEHVEPLDVDALVEHDPVCFATMRVCVGADSRA